MIAENKFYSYNINGFPEGCRMCVKGEKLVLFVTGICPRKCYFCPLSDEKYGKDVIYANEKKTDSEHDIQDIIKEAKNMQAKGAGITGGDPLTKLSRTVAYIKALKQEFGKKFHIHLYTSLNLVSEQTLKELHGAGLDEIRFHPDLNKGMFWKNIEKAKIFSWDIGVEIPVIPTKINQIRNLIDYVHDKISFINLNELEIADNQLSKLLDMGFENKETWSYGVKGSVEAGLVIIEYIQQKKYPLKIHLCTAKLKDKIQLANRIKNEGNAMKRAFDEIDEEGLLIRGALYFPELRPGLGYSQKMKTINKEEYVKKLEKIMNVITRKLKLTETMIAIDKDKIRILLSKKDVKKNKAYFKSLTLVPAAVIEYPTADQFEIEIDFL